MSDNKFKIFVINPGSTSTKIAYFDGDETVYAENVTHAAEDLAQFHEINDQLPYRKEIIAKALEKEGISLEGIDAFSAMGGSLVGLEGGTYRINDKVLEHARAGYTVKHPAMLGSQLAHEFASIYGGREFIVNPPDVDELIDEARMTGLRGVYRESRIHALNQKEIGIRHAKAQGREYEDMNLIIVHIGGGNSVTAHRKGKMIDSNDIINGDGPMAPTRAGSIPGKELINMCFSGEYTQKQMYEKLSKTGGLVDHLGTSDTREVLKMIEEGDKYATLVLGALIYQTIKYIGSMACVLKGEVDGILLTGGVSNSRYLTDKITEHVSFLAPVTIYPGEFEMEALAAGAARVLRGEEQEKEYSGVPVWDGFDFAPN